MTLPELIAELTDRAGHGPVEFDNADGVMIEIDDGIEISIGPGMGGEGMLISSAVGQIPEDAELPFFQALLDGNLMGMGTGGSALGVDREFGEVVLSRTILQDDLPFDDFDRELVVFLSVLRAWRDRLAAGTVTEGPVEPPEEDGAGDSAPPQGIQV